MKFNIPTDKEIAEKACTMILEDLGRNWTAMEMANENHVTVFTLRRIFKRQKGISISDFALQAKMNKAKELLATTNNTIQMIAETVGYTEGNNFQNSFKRMVGCAPGEWRRKGSS